VHKDIRAKLTARLLERVAAVTLQPSLPLDPAAPELSEEQIGKPQMGPVVAKQQYDKIWVK